MRVECRGLEQTSAEVLCCGKVCCGCSGGTGVVDGSKDVAVLRRRNRRFLVRILPF